MKLNSFGKQVTECWFKIPQHFPDVLVDEHIIMPNHFHGITIVGAGSPRPENIIRPENEKCPQNIICPNNINYPQNINDSQNVNYPKYNSILSGRTHLSGKTDLSGGVTNLKGGVTPPLHSILGYPTLGQIVGYFKYQSSKLINQSRHTPGTPVWQRNYYEHIIRNENDLNAIRYYIRNNPANWQSDTEIKS